MTPDLIARLDVDELNRLFQQIPDGPYTALHHQNGWEVRQLDTDPTNKHHWPFRLCESIKGHVAECDEAVFNFIAGVLNAWPVIADALEQSEACRDGYVLVPREPTLAMIEAAENALSAWRKSLDRDEAMMRSYRAHDRTFKASATPAEKHAIRYRAMLAALTPPGEKTTEPQP